MLIVPFKSNKFSHTLAVGVFTADTSNHIYFCTMGSSYTANLPPVSGNRGLRLGFKIGPVTGNAALTIDASGSETIDGALTLLLYVEDDYVELECTGTVWIVVSMSLAAHACCMRRAATQELANATDEDIEFDTIDHNIGAIGTLATGGASGFITVRRAGIYTVSVSVSMAIDDGERLFVRLHIGGTEEIRFVTRSPTASSSQTAAITHTLVLAAADKLEMIVRQDQGSAQNTSTNLALQPRMSVSEQRPPN